MSRNEAAVELLLTYGSRLDIRGSKNDIKNGQAFTPPELAKNMGFTKFHQILKGVQSKKEEADRNGAARKETEKKEAERKEAERKEAERKEAERKEEDKREAEKKEAEKRDTQKKEAERKETDRKVEEGKKDERKEETGKTGSKVTDPEEWMKKYKAGKKKKDGGKVSDGATKNQQNLSGEKEPAVGEPQNNKPTLEEPDTKGPVEKELGKRENKSEEDKFEKKEQNSDRSDNRDPEKTETGREEDEKIEKESNKESVGRPNDLGRPLQRALSAEGSFFHGILHEADKLLQSSDNAKLSTQCKELFGGTSYSKVFYNLFGNQRKFCLMVLRQLFPELSKRIDANFNINQESFNSPSELLHYFDALIKSGVTENVDHGVVFVLGNTKVGKTSFVNTLSNFLENPEKEPEPVLADEKNALLETQVLEYYDKIKLQQSKKIAINLDKDQIKPKLIEFEVDSNPEEERGTATPLNIKLVDMGGHQEYYA